MIYEYALTEEHGLQVIRIHHSRGARQRLRLLPIRPGPTKNIQWDANQLRFVCRQLYQETVGMTFRLNELVFKYSRDFEKYFSGIGLCKDFLASCSPKQHALLKSLIIQEDEVPRYSAAKEALLRDQLRSHNPNLIYNPGRLNAFRKSNPQCHVKFLG